MSRTISPMHRRFPRRAGWSLGVLIVLAAAGTGVSYAQANPSAPRAKLELTGGAEASSEFRAGLLDFDNVYAAGARAHFTRAVELDPSFGLARILHAGTTLAPAERGPELKRGLADAAKASANEQLVAMAYAEQFQGRGEAAFNLFRAAAVAMPGEATLAFRRALTSGALPGRNAMDVQIALRAVKNAFPDFAAVRNTMAYNLWNQGDHDGAMAEVREYVRLLPDHPNSHDSYAELLQWGGWFEEAIAHYRRAGEIDAGYLVGWDGVAEAQVLMGRGDLARATLATAATQAPAAGDPGAHRRIAATHMVDGNAKSALAELGLAAEGAKAAGNTALEGTLHVQAAAVNMWLGDGKAVATHLAAARPLVTAPGGKQQIAMLEALARKDYAAAHASIHSAMQGANPNLIANLEVSEALISVAEGRAEEAMAALKRGNHESPIGRMAMALAARRKGDAGAARAIAYEILANRQFALLNVNDAMARGVARGLVAGAKR